MFGRGKEHDKNPAWIFIYLSVYLSFIMHLLHAKHLDKSIIAQDRKEIQIPKHIIKNYTSSCQQNTHKLSKYTNLITQ